MKSKNEYTPTKRDWILVGLIMVFFLLVELADMQMLTGGI